MAKMNDLTIGIIGGGQLGRMLAMAAARLNHRTIVLEPQVYCPAAQVCNDQIVADYDDERALAELARRCDVVTYEFENVPVAAAETLAASVPVYPPPQAPQRLTGPADGETLPKRLRHSDGRFSRRGQPGRAGGRLGSFRRQGRPENPPHGL